MKLLLMLVLVFVVALMALTVVLFKAMGWLAFLVVPVLLVVGLIALKSLLMKKIEGAFKAPFAAKGAVLKDAAVEVHSVLPASRPSRTYVQQYDPEGDDEVDVNDIEIEEDEEDSEKYARYFTIDATITPQDGDGPFQSWEPLELLLVPAGTVAGEPEDDDEIGTVLEAEIWDEGRWVEDDGLKVPGTRRLRMLVGVNDGVQACRFRYYFEVFGHVDLSDTPALGGVSPRESV